MMPFQNLERAVIHLENRLQNFALLSNGCKISLNFVEIGYVIYVVLIIF